MKRKGISFFELHVEKIVLGLVSAVFLGVLAMQFLFEPNQIKIGNEEAVSPSKAFNAVEKKAETLAAQLNRADVSDLLPKGPAAPTVSAKFKQLREAPSVTNSKIVAMGPGRTLEQIDQVPPRPTDGSGEYAEFIPPAPTTPKAFAYGATIDPAEVLNSPELAAMLPKEQPFDTFYVSVEATVDGTAIQAALNNPSSVGTDTRSPIPQMWWRNAIEILGVRLDRQEMQSDGSWGPETEVPVMPARDDFAAEAKTLQTQTGMTNLLADARRFTSDIARPSFYNTIAGDTWAPPGEAIKALAASGTQVSPEIQRKLAQRDAIQREIDKQKLNLEKLTKPATPNRGGGGGRDTGPAEPDPKVDRALEMQKKRIDDAMKKLDDDYKKATEELVALGHKDPLAATPAGTTPKPTPVEKPKPLLENPSIQVWAHDITAVPGKTYRYRVRLVMNNPFFAKGASLAGPQQTLAAAAVTTGAASEWTTPVSTLSNQYFFVTSASDQNSGSQSAGVSVEMYKFHYGYYRKDSMRLEPGDAIAQSIRLPADANRRPVWDMVKLKDLIDRGESLVAERVEPPLSPAGTPVVPTEVPLPPAAVAGVKEIQFTSPEYLLDVSWLPGTDQRGRTSRKMIANLAMNDGGIVQRSPDEDLTSELLRRLQASAKLGDTQGEVAAPTKIDEKQKQKREEAPPPESPADGGGGGG